VNTSIANPAAAPHAADDLIAAPATPSGQGGIAIVRLSGRAAWQTARRLLSPPWQSRDSATGRFFHTVLRHPADGCQIDEAIVLHFQSPHSYTGEEVVEFQVHGGRQSVRLLLEALTDLGVRPAEPGEFTRRAFLNGRLDLSQAEAVMDLIAAQSERAAHLAVEQLQGSLSHRIDPLYEALTSLCADIEAGLDFDESDVPEEIAADRILAAIDDLRTAAAALLATWREGHLLRDGALVVVSGRPNAGKSSLFNSLLGHPRAIVTPEPGTTRDSIEENLTLDGIPLRLTDTAGLRETESEIERQGVDRATALVERADLHLRVIDPGAGFTADDLATLQQLPPARTVVALNKIDLYPAADRQRIPAAYRVVPVSALTGAGLPELRGALRETLGLAGQGDSAVAVSTRHRDLLLRADAALAEAAQRTGATGDAVLIAQALREAAEALGSITGRNVGEDLLDRIFSRFCIGK